MRSMSLRTGVDRKGEVWVDKHFADTATNAFRMSEILTNLILFQHFRCNGRELRTKLGRLPEAEHPVHWHRGFGILVNPRLGGGPEAASRKKLTQLLSRKKFYNNCRRCAG